VICDLKIYKKTPFVKDFTLWELFFQIWQGIVEEVRTFCEIDYLKRQGIFE